MAKNKKRISCALTIAGSDPSGGAGLQADLKTFYRFGVYGMSVITLQTVQNTRSVFDVKINPPGLVKAQLEAVLSDISPDAIKTGALGNRAVIESVAKKLKGVKVPVVADPVMVSKHGKMLLTVKAARYMVEKFFPRVTLLTPNILEAEWLSGQKIRSVEQMIQAALAIAAMGPKAVLVKGGHKKGKAVDVLYAGGEITYYLSERYPMRHTHGTGCTYSAAIAAGLAKGRSVQDAVDEAKKFISKAIQTAPGLGKGIGPVNHFA